VTCDADRYRDVCEPYLKRIESKLNRIDSTLHGNGRAGLVERVAKVEQGQSRIWWIISGAWAAVLGLLGFILK